ncbi:MAG TPA: MMPL family transporter [Actinomycetota bacterium]|nr:MMPL family transporter [Actinomycetota bacterium]
MASLLYRLGLKSARRPFAVIAIWLMALALAAAAYVTAGGTLASTFNIPGTETARVTSQLEAQFPQLAGMNATVAFQTDDGEPFTTGQRRDIAATLNQLRDLDGVERVVGPFAANAQRAKQEQKLIRGAAKLDSATTQLRQAQAQLDAGATALAAEQQALDDEIAGARADGTYAANADQFAERQKALNQAKATLAEQQKMLDQGRDSIAQGKQQIVLGKRLLEYSQGIDFVSADGATALATVLFSQSMFDLPQDVKNEVAQTLDAVHIDGVSVDYSTELAQDVSGLVGPGEIIGLLVAAVVLFVTLQALLATVLPLVSSLIGVGVGIAGSLAFSGVIDMSSVTPALGVMLGLAVGIDYALFIINRHRRQLHAGMDLHESIALANGTAGNAVVFAGSTVLVALLALNVTGIPFLGVMGTVGAVCVAVAVAVAVSLIPALLSLTGVRVLSRKRRKTIGHEEHREKPLRPMPSWRVVLSLVGALAALLLLAMPAASMRMGLPDGSSEPADSTAYRTYTAVSDQFGAGRNGPLVVVARTPHPIPEEDSLAFQTDITALLRSQEDVVAVAPVAVNDSRYYYVFQVIPREGPASQSTEQLVTQIRQLSPLDGDVRLDVAGQATGNIDISDKLADALPVYLVVVVGLSLILMTIVFRSLLVPVIASAGFVLSFLASMGAVVAVFQWGHLSGVFGVHHPGPVLNFIPILVLGVLFGLAMDYQLFIGSGMREAYVHGASPRLAVAAGMRGGRTVVTAAAIIMISVFGGFAFSHLVLVRPVGFALAFGVLVDAFVVRLVLMPALMHIAGRWAWWLPKWLDRLLPNVDVEGAGLEREHPLPGLHP